MKKSRPPSSPPLFELYGELGKDAALDGLHLESIADRSRLHNWEIKPHRHASLVQLLLIESGTARVQIDGQPLVLQGPAVVWVPMLVVHGFEFAPDTVGHVVTLDQARLRHLPGASPALWGALSAPRAAALERGSPQGQALPAIAQALQHDYAGTAAWRAQVLDGAVLMAAALVARLPPLLAQAEAPPELEPAGRVIQHLARYREQVERHFRSHPNLDQLAAPLGITTTQLNRLCRQHLRCSALDVLHQRLLLEAKRELGYTTLQVRQISDGLGFADPAYFTRFFQRLTGQSPSRWREQR
ncbi:helix-turn-helix domain-containing protein [Roseateles saccharophilus]|uniref:AraC family transcriptional regulator n=1 Tax=Roseateles saccharophilus TaxID=304 RepID=A0A4R3UZC0_ROSSA|nr:helix-turn-helix domain-containing protein [Roseateles saccharophilus]MDG0832730.1 helix-turn-helix domain-containing protein [Roseateles saccharophilus]TCU95334.1 AraC family transcriptional regulator [Roseateles saccharophilus]